MWRYKLLLFLAFIPLALYTLWQSIKAVELRYFLQRLAISFGAENKIPQGGLWVHAASVGEINAVLPLIFKIHARHPELAITITSNTITSASVLKKQLPKDIQHLYFPLDYSWAIKRIINRIKPKTLFIVETEFWPNLFTQLHRKNIPFYIINGRISEKTLLAKKWLLNIYATILPLATHVYARSEIDMSRFISLGLEKRKVEVLGNIKFATSGQEDIQPIKFNRPYVLTASTRENEEKLIVDAWLKSAHSSHLLVIVPRHPQRLSEILKQLNQFHINLSIRSKNNSVVKTTDVYIADTIGELKQFIAGADFVLMGGSFVKKGGHNILEVAQQDKAVIFGPDMRNFQDEADVFKQEHAGIQCTLTELPHYINKLLSDSTFKTNTEENAKKLIQTNSMIIDIYYKSLKHYFN